jgi:hypothetical protein
MLDAAHGLYDDPVTAAWTASGIGPVAMPDVGAPNPASTPTRPSASRTGAGAYMRSPAPTFFKATALPPAKQRKVAAWTHGSKPRIRTVSPSERHPSRYVEKHLIVEAYDCTALWHQAARNEIAKYTRHLTPAQQRVAKGVRLGLHGWRSLLLVAGTPRQEELPLAREDQQGAQTTVRRPRSSPHSCEAAPLPQPEDTDVAALAADADLERGTSRPSSHF